MSVFGFWVRERNRGCHESEVNKYPIAFRQMALERMNNGASVSALVEERGVQRTVLHRHAVIIHQTRRFKLIDRRAQKRSSLSTPSLTFAVDGLRQRFSASKQA